MQQREQIILEKRTFFRFHHSSGTGVSSDNFFSETFGKQTLQHRVSIVIGLTPAFFYGGIGGGRGREVGGIYYS